MRNRFFNLSLHVPCILIEQEVNCIPYISTVWSPLDWIAWACCGNLMDFVIPFVVVIVNLLVSF